jgi:hypothetical protein
MVGPACCADLQTAAARPGPFQPFLEQPLNVWGACTPAAAQEQTQTCVQTQWLH